MLTDFQKRKLALEFLMYDFNRDGVVDRADLHAVAAELAGAYGWTEGSPEFERLTAAYDDIWSLFWSSADADNDGRVNLDERMAGVAHFVSMSPDDVRAPSMPVITALLRAMDADGDGFVSTDEYRRFLRANRSDDASIEEALRQLDTDGDGKMPIPELADMMFSYFTTEDPDAPANWIYARR